MEKINLTEHQLYEVRIIFAVPDYGSGSYSALDILAMHDLGFDEMLVIDMSELKLCLMREVHGFKDIATEVIIAEEKKQPTNTRKPRTKVAAANTYDKWTAQQVEALSQMKAAGMRNKKIAAALGRTEKSIINQVYKMRNGGK
jgi:mevalonate pyrophosphate decarboxylase